MSASLVGSEMCIRDRLEAVAQIGAHADLWQQLRCEVERLGHLVSAQKVAAHKTILDVVNLQAPYCDYCGNCLADWLADEEARAWQVDDA
eukprot:2783245-Alexandrium_andersonii.AAC.1